MADNYVALRIKATDEAKPDLDDLKLKLDELKNKVATARAEVDDAGADATLTDLEAKLEAVSKKVANPKIDMAGATRANAQITAVEASLDDLDAKAAESAAAQEAAAGKAEASAGRWEGAGEKIKMALLGVGVGVAASVYEAGKFQDSTTHLVTDAGESARNLGMVQQGILAVSAATGTSAADITDAMYHIESGGYHGAAGLQLLKTAAEGAKVGGASLDTVSKTLVGTMNAYGLSSSHAASFMNQLIATVGSGDMRMQDLASSLSNVAPLAAKVGLSFAQVGGAIATMTAQGMSAQQSTQDLSNTIRALSNPNNVAINEMQQLGLNSQTVAKNLGREGLTGTITELTKAITDHMGKSGMVIQSAFQSATNAAKDADTMIAAMPAHLQALAKGFLDGSISSKAWRTDLQGLDPVQAHLMTQFAGTAEKAHSFNALLASGSPAAQTYTAALAKMMGGATGLNTALMLTGSNAAVLQRNVDTISAAAKNAGGNVANWSTIQGTFNFKLQQAKASVMDMGISLGSALLPAVTAVIGPLAHMMAVIASNKAASIALAVVIGGLLAGALGVKLAGALKDAGEGIKAAGDGIEWLIGKFTGQAAAAEASAGETAAAETAAAEETSSSWIASAARTVAAWAVTGAQMIAQAAVWVASNTAKVAVIVAENVAAAATTAAAWIAANAAMLLGIGLIVVAVAAAVLLIVKHWHTIMHAIDEVIDYIREHWKLILAILTGPIGLAVLFIIGHYRTIVHAVSEAIDWVRSHWPLLLAILTGPIGVATLFIVDHWRQIVDGARDMLHDVVSFFENLNQRVISIVDGLAGDLFSAGARVISYLAHGIESGIGDVTSAIGNIGSEILSHLPFSPAKKGPLSGAGSPDKRGLKIAQMLAQGLTSGLPEIAQAMDHVTGAIAPRGGYGGTGAGGGQLDMTLRMDRTGNRLNDAIMEAIRIEVRNKGGGGANSVQKTFGRVW